MPSPERKTTVADQSRGGYPPPREIARPELLHLHVNSSCHTVAAMALLAQCTTPTLEGHEQHACFFRPLLVCCHESHKCSSRKTIYDVEPVSQTSEKIIVFSSHKKSGRNVPHMVLVELETMRHSSRSFIRRKTRTEDMSSSGRGMAIERAGNGRSSISS